MPTAVPERSTGLPEDAPRSTRTAPTGRPRKLPRGTTRAAASIGALAVCQAALMIGLGFLITGPARHLWPMTAEDGVNRGLERMRTSTLTTLSSIGSELGNTGTVIGVTLAACLALILIPRLPMWRQASFLALAVSLQSLVFLVVTIAVERQRPDVHRLDGSLPTSSYTSGHTGAATAIYGGLAVLVLSRVRSPWRRVLAALLFLLPVIVGVSRLYRGMHHPTDVAGGMINGALSLLIVGHALLRDGRVSAPAALPEVPEAARAERLPGRVAVVVNPTTVDESARDELRRVLAQHGHREPVFIETTAADPGGGQTAQALAEGAALVVVCGGDGTVRAAADRLAGSGVPLAVVPFGTGNLLARNLGLPLTPAEALDAALGGAPRVMDLARVEGDGLPATHFAVMSGVGLDAAMMKYAEEHDRAKAMLGWPAYVLAAPKAMRGPRMGLSVRLDGGQPLRRTARMALVGNTGALQGGLRLIPDAQPDDGVLDLLILDPQGPGGWLRTVSTLLLHRKRDGEEGDGRPEFRTFRRAEFTFDAPEPREIDGDPVGTGLRLSVEVVPGALTVLVPNREN
ncbi:diacylglycerol kinase family protein [Streptomyces sp. NBC_01171]|uniref:diacylglycerol kinase family protein n=1 Tax=Streptomyces sp. NBC_01171 TaxID=2903757 RepID=UPI00386773D2|nr:diacylglycerol kinase family protein [Streptomyces sp. NBC_01171]